MSSGEYSLVFWDMAFVARLVSRAAAFGMARVFAGLGTEEEADALDVTLRYGFLFAATGCTSAGRVWVSAA